MPDEVSKGLGEFLDYVWRDTPGYIYLATMKQGDQFTQYMVEWPKQRDAIVRNILGWNSSGKDVYYGPALFKERSRPTKDNVLGSHVLWAEFDPSNKTKAGSDHWSVTAKEHGIPEPTAIIQSSVEGHQHVYWRSDDFITNVESIEDRNRAIAYRLGADTTGWDADQLLRPPYTTNYGFKAGGERKAWVGPSTDSADTQLIFRSDTNAPVDGFDSLGTPEREYLERLELGEIPGVNKVLALARWTEDMLTVFSYTKEEAAESSPGKRSAALMRLAYMAAENGFTDEQIYAVVDDADKRWEKYTKRSPAIRDKIIRDTIARARAKVGVPTEELTFAGILGETSVEQSNVKLVYDYDEFLNTEVKIEWLLTGLLAQRGIGIITGHPGVGKTQFGIQLAMNLAIGTEKVLLWENSSGPKKVLFLSLEMNHPSLKLFQETIAPVYEPHRLTLKRNYHIAPLGDAIPLDTPQGQAFADNLMSQYRPDILFIDSLQKMTNKALSDEISSKALTDYLKKIREKYGCAIYFVHHNRKKGNDGAHVGELSDMYGSQFIAADVDFVINMRKLGDSQIISVDNWKNRLAPEFRSFDVTRSEHLQFKPYEGTLDDSHRFASNPILIEPSRKDRTDGDDGESRSIFSM